MITPPQCAYKKEDMSSTKHREEQGVSFVSSLLFLNFGNETVEANCLHLSHWFVNFAECSVLWLK